jgi:hypothetical protein
LLCVPAVADPVVCPLVEPAVCPLVSPPVALGVLVDGVPVWSGLLDVWLLLVLVDVDGDVLWSCAIATAAPNSRVAIVIAIFFIGVSSSRNFPIQSRTGAGSGTLLT